MSNESADDVREAIKDWADFAATFAEKYTSHVEWSKVETFLKFANMGSDFVDAYLALYKSDPEVAVAGIVLAVGVVALVGPELGLTATVVAAGVGVAETSPLFPLLAAY